MQQLVQQLPAWEKVWLQLPSTLQLQASAAVVVVVVGQGLCFKQAVVYCKQVVLVQ